MSITDKLIKIEDKVGFLLMIILIAGIIAIVIFSPAKPKTGSTIKAPISILENPVLGNAEIEQLVRTYFILSALININTNKALGELAADAQKYGRMQKTISDYFVCPLLMRNTAEAKMMRNLILGETVNSTYVPELYCFEEFTTWDLLKFELLEKQCSENMYNYGLDANILSIYDIQRKMLNEGCIMKTQLIKILS
ncbi:MAG: hypothetical protein QW666_04520 [Candidatus Woesearchaeota archaeon]